MILRQQSCNLTLSWTALDWWRLRFCRSARCRSMAILTYVECILLAVVVESSQHSILPAVTVRWSRKWNLPRVNTVATCSTTTTTASDSLFSFLACLLIRPFYSATEMTQIKLISFRFHSTFAVATRRSIISERNSFEQHNTTSRHRPTEMSPWRVYRSGGKKDVSASFPLHQEASFNFTSTLH